MIGRAQAAVVLGALGVVFGDIGTSPLYALKSILKDSGAITRDDVYGVTSLVVWALVTVVGVLHVSVMLTADNEGQGGVLALAALLRRGVTRGRLRVAVGVAAMIGAALFLGDSILTSAISVLSASEGLEVAAPSMSHLVVPLALVILLGVFLLQPVGSGRIGAAYGPVMLAWFVVLGAGGIASLVQDPQVLEALSPTWGVGEAAAVLREPSNAGNPFYGVVASWATVPVLVLGTCATIIASEAVIAGAFTVLHQAGGLDFFPDLRTVHTSRRHPGQIYQPAANWALAVAVLLMVVGFQSSERLANAYGVTVSATVVLTVVLYVVWATRRRPRPAVRLALGVLTGLVAAALFAATLPKLAAGGWVPAAIGAVVFLLMHTWWTGQGRVAGRLREEEVSAGDLAELISGESDLNPLRGHVVFLTHDAEVAPLALRALVDTTRLAPEHVVLLSWEVDDTPSAAPDEASARVRHILSEAMESEPDALADLDLEEALFVASQLRLSTTREAPWAIWRQRLFLGMERLARDKADQLSLPRTRTLVIGRELEL